ncbi:hypothetical protein GW17_00034050 [Ensete ventricosum]|nr:hypothetical protein GW17_00034050 [Ensete ventricosum]RZS25351.1 hypothetical protein BHM03_00058550 [Ensete ventricosum]
MVELGQKMEAAAPYLVMTVTQFCLAGFLVILRSALAPSAGVSATVLVAYQQLLSALVLSLLALLFDRCGTYHTIRTPLPLLSSNASPRRIDSHLL